MTGPRGTPLDLRAVEARLCAASPAPWKHVLDGPMFCGTADTVTGPEIEVRGRVYRGWPDNYNPQVEADAKFIAHAPEDVAMLLAHCHALRAALQLFVVQISRGDGDISIVRQRDGVWFEIASLTWDDLERAAAVLAQGKDEP